MANPPKARASSLPCPPGQADDFLSEPPAEVLRALERQRGPFVVLGAGGKMGLHLTAMLQKALQRLGRSDPVWAVSRFQTLRSREEFDRLGLQSLACDLADPAALAALPDAAAVFFLAGVKFGTAAAPGLLQRLNVEMPRRVAERYRESRIVALSSAAVYPFVPSGGKGADEATPVGPVGEYAASCVGRENAFQEVSDRHGTPAAIIRLAYSVEFRYGVLVDIGQKVLRGEPVDVTPARLNAIWQNDALDHIIRSLEVAAAPAAPLNVTGREILSVREIAERFGRILGCPPRLVGTEAAMTPFCTSELARSRFGEPKVSVEQMIGWVAAWLREVGSTWGKPTGFEVRDGAY